MTFSRLTTKAKLQLMLLLATLMTDLWLTWHTWQRGRHLSATLLVLTLTVVLQLWIMWTKDHGRSV